MAATFSLTRKVLDRDWVTIYGVATLSSSYAQTGEVLNLSAYFDSTTSPVVTLLSRDPTYVLYHDGGTAAAGTIQVYALADGSEASAEADLSTVTCGVIACGPAY